MRGYFFSLEALIAITLLLFPIVNSNLDCQVFDDREEDIYSALDALRSENKLDLENYQIELLVENIVDFDVAVDKNCDKGRIVEYFFVSEEKELNIIRVCY